MVQKVVAGRWSDYVVMSRQQVRDFDAWAIRQMGIPGGVLMENAGRGCTQVILQRLGDAARAKVGIFCGIGNNGGDGYVIARHLANFGADVQVVVCGDRRKIKGDALTNLKIIDRMGLHICCLDLLSAGLPDRVADVTKGCRLIVDALFGTGLRGELSTEYAQLIACINALGAPIVAVDIPSGLDCDAVAGVHRSRRNSDICSRQERFHGRRRNTFRHRRDLRRVYRHRASAYVIVRKANSSWPASDNRSGAGIAPD